MLPIQCKMARTALGWGVRDLAQRASKSPVTVVKFESGEAVRDTTADDLRRAFEKAGIIFIDSNGGGPGVRLKRKPKR